MLLIKFIEGYLPVVQFVNYGERQNSTGFFLLPSLMELINKIFADLNKILKAKKMFNQMWILKYEYKY